MPNGVLTHVIQEDFSQLLNILDKEFAGHIIGPQSVSGTKKANALILMESYRLKPLNHEKGPRVEDPELLTGRHHHATDQVRQVDATRAGTAEAVHRLTPQAELEGTHLAELKLVSGVK